MRIYYLNRVRQAGFLYPKIVTTLFCRNTLYHALQRQNSKHLWLTELECLCDVLILVKMHRWFFVHSDVFDRVFFVWFGSKNTFCTQLWQEKGITQPIFGRQQWLFLYHHQIEWGMDAYNKQWQIDVVSDNWVEQCIRRWLPQLVTTSLIYFSRGDCYNYEEVTLTTTRRGGVYIILYWGEQSMDKAELLASLRTIKSFSLILLTLANIARGKPSNHIVNPHPFTYVINNAHLCDHSPDTLIWIHTAPTHYRHRTLIRETWANPSHFKTRNTSLVFFLGKSENTTIQRMIEYESDN